MMHAGLFAACMYSLFDLGFSALPYIAFILGIQWIYFKRLIGRSLLFLKPRQWQFDLSAVRLQLDGQWYDVDIRSVRVLQSMIMVGFRYKNSEHKWWSTHTDVFMFDACDAETFRQTRAYLRTHIQLKDNSIS